MELSQVLQDHRKRKGLTQEELAERSGVTVRTIQRIEGGETVPRAYTLKAIAGALDLAPEALLPVPLVLAPGIPAPAVDREELLHFLRLLCLSCFSFIVLPWVHFLLPQAMLRRQPDLPAPVRSFGRRLVRSQVYWVVALNGGLLAITAFNYTLTRRTGVAIPYLPFVFAMFGGNALLLLWALLQTKTLLRDLPLTD
ncbi:helix-turn-helix domain-containing protein [Flaviaesturariibacter aridisoli]|uniref:XRE family transcriptional regulator n=1 Tax=Flaviaesturariibacter aridisoli TaxID=2545761 RepID=A0A4R4E743_9BACT|nr:helix-turn-helix transcriptional regulator [Flaviaesturariibacter aridisoli]TCZ74887.1 XRE family transcriptional regulator [Flaviaesturariibacter aridisoli]